MLTWHSECRRLATSFQSRVEFTTAVSTRDRSTMLCFCVYGQDPGSYATYLWWRRCFLIIFFYFYFFLMFQSTNRCCVNVPRAFKWCGNVVFNGVSHSGGLICGHSLTLCVAMYRIRDSKRNLVFLSDVKILSCMTIRIPVASGVLRHDVVSLRHTVLLPQHSNLLLNSKLTHSLAYTLTWVNWNSGL